MDSTLRSNISVGFPLDLLVYETDALAVSRFVTIDEKNQYFQMIRNNWGKQLKSVFEGIADPVWTAAPEATSNVLSSMGSVTQPVRVAPPATLAGSGPRVTQLQTLAQDEGGNRQY
jgi:putative proteasome-type protease